MLDISGSSFTDIDSAAGRAFADISSNGARLGLKKSDISSCALSALRFSFSRDLERVLSSPFLLEVCLER